MTTTVEGLRVGRASRSRWSRSAQVRMGGWIVFVGAVFYVVVSPILSLQLRAFSGGGEGFRKAWALPNIGDILRNTVALGLGSVVIAVAVGTCTAWAVSCLPRRAAPFLSWIPLAPLLVPPVATVAGWGFLLSPSAGYANTLLRKTPFFQHLADGPINVYTVPWVVIITGVILSAYVHLFVHTSLREIGPQYALAASASGASPARTFMTITLPLLRPAIVYSSVIVLLLGLGQFVAPLLLGRQEGIDVLTTSMWKLSQTYPIEYNTGAALGSPLILLGIVVILLQKKLVRGGDRYILTGSDSGRPVAQAGGRAAITIITIYGLLTSVLPILALVYVSLSPFWSSNLSVDSLTLDNFRAVFDDPIARGALRTSISSSVIAALVVVPAGSLCALGLWKRHRLPRWVAWLLDVTVSIPLAVAAALMGFGLLFTYSSPPLVLYGRDGMLILTYFILMLPFVTRLMMASLISVGDSFFEASATSGAHRGRTLLRVGIPLCRGGIGAAVGISLVLMIHEFAASLMVRSPTTQVLGSYLWDQWARGSYPRAAVAALLMICVTGCGLAIARLISGSRTSKGR